MTLLYLDEPYFQKKIAYGATKSKTVHLFTRNDQDFPYKTTTMASRNFTDFPDRKLSSEFRGKWRVSLFGCLVNPGLSLLTCLLPCYTAGRNARAVGDHGVSVGLLYFLLWPYGVYIAAETRRRIRERKVINVEDPVSQIMSVYYYVQAMQF